MAKVTVSDVQPKPEISSISGSKYFIVTTRPDPLQSDSKKIELISNCSPFDVMEIFSVLLPALEPYLDEYENGVKPAPVSSVFKNNSFIM